jgi:hypothetical protein
MNDWWKVWKAARKLAGLPGKRLDDCRRTAARNLIRSGTPLERFPIVRSTAVMVLLSAGGEDGAVLDGFAHSRVGGL